VIRPLVGGTIAGDGVEQRGLAGAVGADDGAALAARHGQADAVDRAQASKATTTSVSVRIGSDTNIFRWSIVRRSGPVRRPTMRSMSRDAAIGRVPGTAIRSS
jgi:hypothetical protein